MKRNLVLVVGTAALLCAAPAAYAQDTTRPAPCNGVAQIVDPSADSHHPNMDVLRAWFDRGADGAVTLSIEVANLGPVIDHAENDRLLWRGIFTAADGARHYVQATHRRGQAAATFEHGRASGLNTTKEGDTSGRLLPGKPGLVQISVPSFLAPEGSIVGKPVVIAAEANDVKTSWFERAPGGDDPADASETSTGADWRVAVCGAGAGAPAGGGAGAPAGPGTVVSGIGLEQALLSARYGKTVLVRGAVSPAVGGIAVEVLDDANAVRVKLLTDAQGRFAFRVLVRRNAAMRVRTAGLESAPVRITMSSLLKLATPRRTKAGVRVSGTLIPSAATSVAIEQRSGNQWVEVGSARVRGGRFATTLRGIKKGRFRAVLEDGDTTTRTAARRAK